MEYLLEVSNLTKSFPGVLALDNVNLRVKKGTIHALMGENGAGKSTLMKCLLGIYTTDSGQIKFRGKEVNIKNTKHALNIGISMIHQELSSIQHMSVVQNIFLGKEETFGRSILLDKKKMYNSIVELFKLLEINIDPNKKMRELSIAQQQICEIAKAISYNADLIIMDEPTSAITEKEVEHLFKIIRNLKEKGITMIYISHKMDEIFKITDDITVYRDGQYVNEVSTKDSSPNELIQMMVGRELTQVFDKHTNEIKDTILEVKDLCLKGKFRNVSFKLNKGEVLGFAGLMGAGRSEVMETIFGIQKKDSGEIFISGKKVDIKSPRNAISHKIALLTEDRKLTGCFLILSVKENTVVASIRDYSKYAFINNKAIISTCESAKVKFNIKTPSIEQKMKNLSGGNQQKVLVARWMQTDPDILIVDEPTRGIDVGAKSEIYKIINTLASRGKAIIIVSSELPEVLGMSDRIIVMSQGVITGELSREEATQEKILGYATNFDDVKAL